MAEALDQPRGDRVTARNHHDWNRLGGVMGRLRGRLARRDNNVHVELHELCGGRRQPLISAIRAATIDDDAGSRDVSEISETALQQRGVAVWPEIQPADVSDLRC